MNDPNKISSLFLTKSLKILVQSTDEVYDLAHKNGQIIGVLFTSVVPVVVIYVNDPTKELPSPRVLGVRKKSSPSLVEAI